VRRNTPDSVEVLLKDDSGQPFVFQPGQFFMVNVEIDGQMVRRTYSATNAPGEFDGAIRLGVKHRPGGLVSGYINERLKVGDRVVLKGPGGKLVLPPGQGARHLVMIAGGSGITPMMSMSRAALASEAGTRVTLVYLNRCMSDVMFLSELNDMAAAHPDRFSVIHVLSEVPAGWTGYGGHMDRDMLGEILEAIPSADEFMVCGSPAMMESVRGNLIELGVPETRVRTETFNVPEDV
jgi:ferredoxin-NADP reductase